jgi:signal transduction histidine kinase/uncharacterized protein YhfF
VTDLLHTIAEGTANVVGQPFLRSLVRHVAIAFDAEVAFVAEVIPERPKRARVLASWQTGVHLPEGTEFDVGTAPCEGPAAGLELPIHGVDGSHVGNIGVMSKRPIEATDDERVALTIFAARAGAEIERRRQEEALRAHEAEVAASRMRIVQSAEDERRRIGRNLHDGAQQRLVAIGHFLDVARKKMADSAPDAAPLVERAGDEAREAGRELRELARGLNPASLTERGLGVALTTLAGNCPLPVRLESVPERRLPDPVETALYYLVSEALTNAVKYAEATEVRVDIDQRGRSIVATVADDGRGGASADGGSGLHSLADRVAALGGTLGVESPPGGGTRLTASIPTGPWRSTREQVLEFGHEQDGGLGERLIAQILAGRKRASVSLAREFELEGGPPRLGHDIPVVDHTGQLHAMVSVERVAVLPFGEIGPDVVTAEGAGEKSIDEWREGQRAFYAGCRDEIAIVLGEPGWHLTDEEPMVVTWFRLTESARE